MSLTNMKAFLQYANKQHQRWLHANKYKGVKKRIVKAVEFNGVHQSNGKK